MIYFIAFVVFYKWLMLFITLLPVRIIHLMMKKGLYEKSVMKQGGNYSTVKMRGGLFFIKNLVYSYIQLTVYWTGNIKSHAIRDFLYRYVYLVDMKRSNVIHYGVEIRNAYNLKIGDGTIIGDRAILDARNGIEIGKNVNLSSNVQIWSEQHDHRDILFRCSLNKRKIIIADRVWLGPNSMILPEVTIGEGAVVAGGAIVTKDVMPYTIVAGIPAKKIGDRNRDIQYSFNGKGHRLFL